MNEECKIEINLCLIFFVKVAKYLMLEEHDYESILLDYRTFDILTSLLLNSAFKPPSRPLYFATLGE